MILTGVFFRQHELVRTMIKDILSAILIVALVVIGIAVLIPALPVILSIVYLGGRMIWCLLTGEPFWGEYGPFW